MRDWRTWGIVLGALLLAGLGVKLFLAPAERPYLDLASYLLAVAGFVALWLQVRKARNAAEVAQQATRDTLVKMSERFTIADLSEVRSKLGHVQEALRGERFETALRDIQDLRAGLTQLRTRKGFTDEAHQTQIQDIVVTLAKFQDRLERRLNDDAVDVQVPVLNKKLADYILIVTSWGEELQFQATGQ